MKAIDSETRQRAEHLPLPPPPPPHPHYDVCPASFMHIYVLLCGNAAFFSPLCAN